MLKKFINSNSFLIGVCVSVSLAWLLPQLGSSGGLLRSEIMTKLGVFVIFIIQGLTLPTNELRDGLFQWRLHLFCQGSNYLLLPLLGIAV
ncbi:MAG: bile acid:sodium symporter, partial [Opitutales bacterium]|nr:bile acid:sodium symporter [Opitutales bacterium]